MTAPFPDLCGRVAVVSGGNIDLSRFASLVGACPPAGDGRAL